MIGRVWRALFGPPDFSLPWAGSSDSGGSDEAIALDEALARPWSAASPVEVPQPMLQRPAPGESPRRIGRWTELHS